MFADPDHHRDTDLMLRLKAGDDLALNELMSRWQQPLAAFLLRYTANEFDVLDLSQETFVRVYESRRRYQPTAKFSTWLFTIAANLSRNLARWRERHPTVSLYAPGDGSTLSLEQSLPAPGESPVDSAEREDLAGAVREHIQRLPHDLKTAVLLSEYHDLSHAEIAGVLGCSAKAVETRLYRARRALHSSLSAWKLG